MKTLLFALVLLAGCTNPVSYEGVTPFEPPSFYASWYAETERCLGVSGHFDRIEWFRADDIKFADGSGRIGGAQDGDRITIREDWILWFPVVVHEMIHHISGLGNEDHETEPFLRCG